MKAGIVIPIMIIGMISCQTTSYQDKFGPRTTQLGETVNAPFDKMIANAKPKELSVGMVYFPADTADLSSDAMNELQSIAHILNTSPGTVIVEGHTGQENNDRVELGYKRALTVAEYLKRSGVWEERLYIKSFADNRPIASNLTDLQTNPNQRVEVKVLMQGDGISGKEAASIYNEMTTTETKQPAATQLIVPIAASNNSGKDE